MIGKLALQTVALVFAAASSPAFAQDAGADAGQLVFNNACRTCHSVKENDSRLGPDLHAIVGRKAGSLPGFGYSDSMKSSGLTWDEATLDRFIANPDEVVPGNRMKPYGGLANAEERAKIVAYLKGQGG
jgi:cytochrome c